MSDASDRILLKRITTLIGLLNLMRDNRDLWRDTAMQYHEDHWIPTSDQGIDVIHPRTLRYLDAIWNKVEPSDDNNLIAPHTEIPISLTKFRDAMAATDILVDVNPCALCGQTAEYPGFVNAPNSTTRRFCRHCHQLHDRKYMSK